MQFQLGPRTRSGVHRLEIFTAQVQPVAKNLHMSQADRGYAAAIEHGYPEIQKLEEQLQILEQQISGTRMGGAALSEVVSGHAPAIEHSYPGIQKLKTQLLEAQLLQQQIKNLNATQSGTEMGGVVLSEAARGYAAAIEHGDPEIQKLGEELQMLEQQIQNLNVSTALKLGTS